MLKMCICRRKDLVTRFRLKMMSSGRNFRVTSVTSINLSVSKVDLWLRNGSGRSTNAGLRNVDTSRWCTVKANQTSSYGSVADQSIVVEVIKTIEVIESIVVDALYASDSSDSCADSSLDVHMICVACERGANDGSDC